jgi:LysM repeat protein
MFASRLVLIGVVLLALFAIALGAARSSSGAAPETRYLVQPGDTLWMLATTRYEGDPREALWRIQERNGLTSPMLRPGEVIVLP